jgi:hypothetical protein
VILHDFIVSLWPKSIIQRMVRTIKHFNGAASEKALFGTTGMIGK